MPRLSSGRHVATSATPFFDAIESGSEESMYYSILAIRLTELQRACEAILGRTLDKGAFRRQIKDARDLVKVSGAFVRGAQRPAQLYRAAAGFAF